MRLPLVLSQTILLAAAASVLGSLAVSMPLAQSRPVIPSVTSYSLDKIKVTLPDDLSGQQNVLILFFKPDQGDAAIAWATALQPIRYAHPGLQSYVLPIYSRENFLYRWWIGASLRSNAPPAQEWRSTIPLFVDKTSFLPALHIPSEKNFIVLLADKAGLIEWRTEGPVDDRKLGALVAVSAPLLSAEPHPQSANSAH